MQTTFLGYVPTTPAKIPVDEHVYEAYEVKKVR